MFSEEAFSTVLEETVAFKTGGSCISAAAAAKSLQSCPTLCDPIDGSPPGSPVPGLVYPKTKAVASEYSTQNPMNYMIDHLACGNPVFPSPG